MKLIRFCTILFLLSSSLFAQPLNFPVTPYIGKSGTTLFIPMRTGNGAVITIPTLSVNNNPVTLTPGPISAKFWSFTLGINVNPGDIISNITAPDGWVLNQPALNSAVTNYSGVPEFKKPKQLMGLGMMMAHPQIIPNANYCPVRNWATRISNWSPLPVAIDAAGNPTQITGPTSANISNSNYTNFVDNKGFPGPIGVYTVIADLNDLQTDIELVGLVGTTCTPLNSNLGVNGVESIKTFQVTVDNNIVNGPSIKIVIKHPNNTPNFSNLWIIPPGNPINRDDPLASELNIDKLLRIGHKGPSVLRWMDSINNYGGLSNAVNASDIPSLPTTTSWVNTTKKNVVPISIIRPVAFPNIIRTIYGDWPFNDLSWVIGPRWCAEVVTAVPHGFTTGQACAITSPTPINSTAGGLAVRVDLTVNIYVTSDTSFLICSWANTLQGSKVYNLDNIIKCTNVTANQGVPGGYITPLEFAVKFSSRYKNNIFWLNFPFAGSDDLAHSYAKRILPYLGSTNKIIIEVSNEPWNFIYANTDLNYNLSRLSGAKTTYVAKRTLEVASIFKQEFGERSDDVISVFAWQFGSLNGHLSNCSTLGLKADAVAAAPYFDFPKTWSVINWTVPQIHDLMRAYLMFDPTPQNMLNDFTVSVANYEVATKQRVLRLGYEAGVSTLIRSSTTGAQVWNLYSHPDMLITENLFYSICQQAGFDSLACESLIMSLQNDGVTNFGYYQYQSQLPGLGDGSDGKMINPVLTNIWQPSTSVRGEAWRRWQTGFLTDN